jgi:hypothetical protein
MGTVSCPWRHPSGPETADLLYALIIGILKKQQALPLFEPPLADIAVGILLIAGIFMVLGISAALIPCIRSAKIDPSSAMALGDID